MSPSKDCWSRYDIDANFRVLAEWLGPDFPRAIIFPELQWLSGAQEYRPLEISNLGVVDPRQSRRQPLDLPPTPIDWMFSFCSHGAQECPDVNAWQHSKKSEAETTALVEAEVAEAIAWRRCACGFARDSDRERVPGDRNRTIDRSNLDGLRAGPDAQGISTDHEDLEASVV